MNLVAQGLMSSPWVGLDQRDKERSKLGVLARELGSEGGKDEMEVAPILKISRAEEGGSKVSIRERPLRNRLRNSGLPRSGQPAQPVDRGLAEVPRPEIDLVQNSPASPLQTTSTIVMPKVGTFCMAKTLEDCCFVCRMFMSGAYDQK